MTTVAWDGHELVADSLAMHLGRTASGELVNVRPATEAVVKIIDGENYAIRGKRVLAIGFSGDVTVFNGIKRCGEEADAMGMRRELCVPGMWDSAVERGLLFACIAVMEDLKSVVLNWDTTIGARGVQWTEWPAGVGLLVVGSGKEVIPAECFKTLAITARQAVSLAARKDPKTGGTMTVWKDGVIHTGLPMMRRWGALANFLLVGIPRTWRNAKASHQVRKVQLRQAAVVSMNKE